MNFMPALFFFEYILSILHTILIYRFGTIFLRKNNIQRRELVFYSLVFSSAIFLFMISPVTLLQEHLFVFPLMIIFLSLVFSDRKSVIFLVTLTFLLIFVVISVCVTLGVQSYFDSDFHIFYQTGFERAFALLISRLLMLIGIELMSRGWKSKHINPFVTSGGVIGLYIFSFLIVSVLFEIFFENAKGSADESIPYMVTIFVLFFTILFILSARFIVNKTQLLETQDRLDEAKFKQQASVKELDHYLGIMQTKHDLKNHLIVVRHLVENGNRKASLDYLQSMQSLDAFRTFVHTNNDIINAILNSKISDNPDIKFKVSVNIKTFPFKSLYVSTILGNALDNAIEAVKYLDKEQRKIEVVISENEQYGKIAITNPYSGELNIVEDKFFSTKRDNREGLGIASIQKVIREIDGRVEYTTDNGQFKFVVLIRKQDSHFD